MSLNGYEVPKDSNGLAVTDTCHCWKIKNEGMWTVDGVLSSRFLNWFVPDTTTMAKSKISKAMNASGRFFSHSWSSTAYSKWITNKSKNTRPSYVNACTLTRMEVYDFHSASSHNINQQKSFTDPVITMYFAPDGSGGYQRSPSKSLFLWGQSVFIIAQLLTAGLLHINELDMIRRYLPSYNRPRKGGRYSAFQVRKCFEIFFCPSIMGFWKTWWLNFVIAHWAKWRSNITWRRCGEFFLTYSTTREFYDFFVELRCSDT